MNEIATSCSALTPALSAFLVEALCLGWQNSSLRRLCRSTDRSQWSDMVYFVAFGPLFGEGVLNLASAGTFYGLGRLINQFCSHLAGWHIHLDTGYGALNFAVYFIIQTFMEYANHWIMHRGAFWNLHRFHHSATSINPLLAARNHPGSRVFEMLFLSLPAGIIAVPIVDLVILGMLRNLYEYFLHCNINLSLGWVGRWIFLSPNGHRLHHSSAPEHYGKNLCILIAWDRLFGTYYHGDIPVTEYGVEGERYNERGVFVDTVSDYIRFFRALIDPLLPTKKEKGEVAT